MNPDSPAAALAPLAQALDAMGLRWFVSGSLASSIHGIPRATNDVDVVVRMHPAQADALVERLGEGYYGDAVMIRDAFLRQNACNLIWLASMMKIDLCPPRLSCDRMALDRRQRAELDDGAGVTVPIFVASPEDSILSKLAWYRQGGGVSERQLRDISGIVALRGSDLDRDYLRRWALDMDVTALMDQVLRPLPQQTEGSDS